VFNFITVFEFLEAEGGVIRVDGGAELGQAVVTVLEDADTRQRMGEGASAVVDANRGAVERLVDGVARLRDQRC